jgi:hypothetical protein
MSRLSFTSWTHALSARGYAVLAASHAVPVSLWLLDPAREQVLHFTARGTRLRLAAYDRSDLTTLLLRAECDCEAHRQAGASSRTVLRPGALPQEEHVLDGGQVFGWTGHEAALLPLEQAAGILESLLARLAVATHEAAPVAATA